MDRDELDDRLRQRGGEGQFRRGMHPDDAARGGRPPGYEPFRPEPEDEIVRRAPGAGGSAPHVDHTGPGFDERPAPPPPPLPPPPSVFRPPPPPLPAPVPAYEPPPPPPPVSPEEPLPTAEWPEEPVGVSDLAADELPLPDESAPADELPLPDESAPADELPPAPVEVPEPEVEAESDAEPEAEPEPAPFEDPNWVPAPPPDWQPPPPAYEPPPVRYAEEPVPPAGKWGGDEEGYEPAAYHDYGDDDRGAGGGIGPLMVGLFVVLGILAVGIGAALSGVFGNGVAQASPTPSALVTQQATPSPTVDASVEPTVAATVEPTPASGSPLIFPDGFTAETQPCAEQPESFSGCDSSGATVSDGAVWVWIGFRQGNEVDVISVTIVDATGSSAGEGSVGLTIIDCGESCNGWLRFRFASLEPGNYGIRIARNGLPAAEASFTVLS